MIKTKKRGILFVVSGPSGCGKDTVIQELMKKRKKLWLSISCTSREMRPGEINEKDYYFLSKDEFEDKIKNDELLEYAEYAGNYYGTPREHIEKHLSDGEDVVLVIEIVGALKIKELLPDTLFIFILPPSMKELRKRLTGRGTESKDKIDKRFKRAYEEINAVNDYNYVVVNDDVENAVEKINAILISEECRVDRIEKLDVDNVEEEIHETLINESKK